jgi:hypothetical protein
MSARRPLGDMLVEVTTGTLDALVSAPGLRVRRIALTLPVEVALSRGGHRTDILGDLPRSVTRTAFDIKPGRLVVVWEEGEAS